MAVVRTDCPLELDRLLVGSSVSDPRIDRKPPYLVQDEARQQAKRDALDTIWVALEKLRLHGSPWWKDEWGEPSKIAHDALNEANRLAPGGILDD